jgi:hypothetical protein
MSNVPSPHTSTTVAGNRSFLSPRHGAITRSPTYHSNEVIDYPSRSAGPTAPIESIDGYLLYATPLRLLLAMEEEAFVRRWLRWAIFILIACFPVYLCSFHLYPSDLSLKFGDQLPCCDLGRVLRTTRTRLTLEVWTTSYLMH